MSFLPSIYCHKVLRENRLITFRKSIKISLAEIPLFQEKEGKDGVLKLNFLIFSGLIGRYY